MNKKITLGAPSLIGKGANDLAANGFSGAVYPMKAVITNHMPRDISLPEIKGLFLRNVCNSEGLNRATVEITNETQLKRVISDVEQIAELNGYKKALTIEDCSVVQQDAASENEQAQPDDTVNPDAGDSKISDQVDAVEDKRSLPKKGLSKNHKRGQ